MLIHLNNKLFWLYCISTIIIIVFCHFIDQTKKKGVKKSWTLNLCLIQCSKIYIEFGIFFFCFFDLLVCIIEIILRSWCLTSGIDHYHRKEWMIIPYYIHTFDCAASLTLGWWTEQFSFSFYFSTFSKKCVRRRRRKKEHFSR